MLNLTGEVHLAMLAHAYDGLPDEACGLMAGDPATGACHKFYPCTNAAASSRIYSLDPREYMRAERDAEDHGWEVIGVMHSHTHTEPYPSPTDVAQAPDPNWHYVIVSLKRDRPQLRSYRIVDETIAEEPVVVGNGGDRLES